MTNSEPRRPTARPTGIGDDQLPEDLQPAEDNPLAEPLDDRDDAHEPRRARHAGGKPEADHEDEAGDADRRRRAATRPERLRRVLARRVTSAGRPAA